MDFASADASRAVTAALLAEHYGVAWSVTPGQLIPPVPGRANYIAWLADLLALSAPLGAFRCKQLAILLKTASLLTQSTTAQLL